jgi:hypothetical protein
VSFIATQAALLEVLRREVAGSGSQEIVAKRLRVSPQYLCDVLKGRREPGRKLLDALGYRRITVYEKLATEERK